MCKQIYLVADREQFSQISEYWTDLLDEFIDVADHFDKEGNTIRRKEFSARRTLLKQVKKEMRALKQLEA